MKAKSKYAEQRKGYREAHREEIHTYNCAYYQTHRESMDRRAKTWIATRPIYRSVKDHYFKIFTSTRKHDRTYKGMPFFDAWNFKKGGSYQLGADWILENLGEKPPSSSLHIVNHAKGFVPGNLEWATHTIQNREQMCKIIANLRNRVKELEAQLRRYQGDE